MAAPSALPGAVAEVLVGALQAAGNAVPDALAGVAPSEQANRIAASLDSGQKVAVLMGNMAVAFGQAPMIAANAEGLASAAGGRFGFLMAGGHLVGGDMAGDMGRAQA